MAGPVFKPLPLPVPWEGYFGRESGHPYAFRVRRHSSVRFDACADWVIGEKTLEIPFVLAPGQPYDTAPRDLSVGVSDVMKRGGGGLFDGAFIINEFGDVLVPSRDSSHVLRVGAWHGPIWLEDAYHPAADPIELYSAEGLRHGDTWKRPYVGTAYHTVVTTTTRVMLAAREGRPHVNAKGYFEDEVLPLLRMVHWDSKIQFLVTHGGLLLTRVALSAKGKQEPPTFCGVLDLEKWRTVVAAL